MKTFITLCNLMVFQFLFLNSILAQGYEPGVSYMDSSGYIEFVGGNVPVIISAPHGGYLEPDSLPDCPNCSSNRDAYTQEIARGIRDAFFKLTGCYPNVVINLLHRKKLDMNRNLEEATGSVPVLVQAWNAYHSFVDQAKQKIEADYGQGIFIDLHGHGHEIQRIEMGYLHSKSDLQLTDDELNNQSYFEETSIHSLSNTNLNNLSHAELLRGEFSFGTIMSEKGFPSVPSMSDPFPEDDDSYFTGGYNTRRHGSRNGGQIDAVQFEFNQDIRFEDDVRQDLIDSLSISIVEYIDKHYQEDFSSSLCNSAVSGVDGDLNNDGELNVLVLGTNNSINGSDIFSPNQIAFELQNILTFDDSLSSKVNVVAEDIHMSKSITVGLGGDGDESIMTHHSHSLLQYYYWPEGHEERLENLSGNAGTDWDYVVIGSDPYILSTTPGYYSLGVNKIAKKAEEGGARPLLLMEWMKDATDESIKHFEEYTYRTAHGAKVEIQTIPAGLAWQALPEDKKDNSTIHPSPNGSYLTAAAIYTEIIGKDASSSEYAYDDSLAEIAFTVLEISKNKEHYSGERVFVSPFKSCNVGDKNINYKHTGSSSENGIERGLEWIFDKSTKTLEEGGEPPINFNYGRANINFEPNKRYEINPSEYNFSLGFPMQDHGNNGDVSMLYGLDRRESGVLNDTDLGVAHFMIEEMDLPYARTIPIRTLYAQIEEAIPGHSAYRDVWHMHRDLDKASAAFMFTLLTGSCDLDEEPNDQTSDAWATWMSHKIGYETAWNFMYLEGNAPNCDELIDEDGDGFISLVDCNDNDPSINSGIVEIPYNGIDDDCNELTFDDDLDQDGFGMEVDCDDTNPDVNPDAIEIPNNDIDDDCDGEDLLSSVYELSNAKILIYPNPASSMINIKVDGVLNFSAVLYNIEGKIIKQIGNNSIMSLNTIPNGNYVLEIRDLDSEQKIVEKIAVY